MSSAHHPIDSAEDAERLLGSLAGVVSAHVVADATGDIVEIHILSSAELHPKQMVRNVESALSAGLGIKIDRRVVSVAQIRSDVDTNGHRPGSAPPLETEPEVRALVADEPARAGDREPERRATGPGAPSADQVPEPTPPRLEFVRYEARRDAELCHCDVVLRAGKDQITGTGAGPVTTDGRAEAAARAVFDGIGRARPEMKIVLEAAVTSSSRGREYVIVAAHAVLDRGTVALAGAAPLTRSPEEAAILAALQATNRWNA
ncbi:MAG: hypothetical protein ACN0LA_01850 [Candidatus Longimicrobiales bacterium M2_2A_002]